MLIIDNENFNITKKQISVEDIIGNGQKGYNICIHLEFSINNNNGYLNLNVGFEKNNNINNFVNRKFEGIPFENDDAYICFEVFDTKKFLDTEIESNIFIEFEDKINNTIKANFEINDELIKIKFDDYLDII